MRCISVSSLNSNGVSVTDKHPNKPYNIQRLINKATVAMLQETHLSINSGLKPLNAIFPADIFELDYSHGSGLAAGLCTATPLEASSQLCHESHLFLSTHCSFVKPFKFSAYFVNVYFGHPNKDTVASLVRYLEGLPLDANVIIMGDFNMSPSPSHATSKLFEELSCSLRRLQIVHHPTCFPTHHPRNSHCNPTFIDHVFLRLPGSIKATNTVIHTQFDHDLVTVFLTESEGSSLSSAQLRSKAYRDPNFPKYLADWHKKQPFPQDYTPFVRKLESLAAKFLADCKRPKSTTPLFLFALLHALRSRDIQRWNDAAVANACPNLVVSTTKELLTSTNKLTELFFLSNSPFYVTDPNLKRWYLQYLRDLIPPTKAGGLSSIHPTEELPPTTDTEFIKSSIEATWAPVFQKKEPEYNLDRFLNKIQHLLPDYSGFSLNLSDAAIQSTVFSLPNDSAPGPDGIPYSLIKQSLPIFLPVIHSIYNRMASGSLPAEGYTDGFINFIEKKGCVPTAGNLRPLTIPNTLHRLVGKLISDQLQPFLAQNLHPSQSAFVRQRWITNNVANVNEVLKKKSSGWLLFVDFSKAYDSIDRDALLLILRKLKFEKNIIGFVKTSLKPYKVFSESLGVDIQVERGVPQGWSLSCVLFNLALDSLLLTFSHTLPELFQSAFADDLAFHHLCYSQLPIVQKFINQYGNAIGLSVNEKKCAIIHLGPGPPPSSRSIWGSPFVQEYKYLGVLLGISVPIEKVFEGALHKLKERAASFASIKANFTSKILLAKIYLYPLFSYLLNFYSFPSITEKTFCSIIQKFIFPWGNLRGDLLFAYPSVMAQPALEHPRAYALRFTFILEHCQKPHPLLEPDQPLKLPKKLNSSVLLEKLDKLTPVTRVGIQNFSLAQQMHYKIGHFFLLAICNCLPFHSRVHHFMTIPSCCALCLQDQGDNPSHLFSKCEIGKMALILLRPQLPYVPRFNNMPSALMTEELLTAQQLFYHVCFAKALWKARCQAIWCVNQVSPQHVCILFWEAVKKTKKTAPSLEDQRSIIPLGDIDEWSLKTKRFL